MIKIIVIGKSGQLAWELSQLCTASIEIKCFGRDQIDITDKTQLLSVFKQEKPDAIINASAYTAVDLAETENDDAFKINAEAVMNLAEACHELSLFLVHVSTDFVFDGKKGSPYLTDDPIKPLNIYGASKAKGEEYIKKILPDNSCIIRTSWVYSTHGNNFVKTMLKFMESKPKLDIIADQIGTPTYAKVLAEVAIFSALNKVTGIHHWTDAGIASWYDFAVAIQELALEKELLLKEIPINAINTEAYPTPAKRPSYSVLDKNSCKDAFPSLTPIHWRKQLSNMLNALNDANKQYQ